MKKKTVGQKVKGHFKKHKVKYIVGGACLVVGGTVGYYVGKHYYGGIMDVITKVEPTNVAIGKDINIENKTDITNNVTNVNMGGHVRKLVRRLSDGKLFGSVNEAASEAGVPQPLMSNHLNGRKDNINGDTYEIAGLSTN